MEERERERERESTSATTSPRITWCASQISHIQLYANHTMTLTITATPTHYNTTFTCTCMYTVHPYITIIRTPWPHSSRQWLYRETTNIHLYMKVIFIWKFVVMEHYEGTPDVYIHPSSINHNHTIEKVQPTDQHNTHNLQGLPQSIQHYWPVLTSKADSTNSWQKWLHNGRD